MTRKGLSLVAIVGLATLFFGPAGTSVQARVRGSAAAAPASAPSLGAAAGFGVLGGQTVTNTGSSTITGDVGVWPGSAITGFPPGTIVSGGTHAGDALAQSAQSSLTTAYNLAAGQTCNTDLTGQNLGGLTLTTGVYCFTSAAQLTGTLTLNFQGNANAIFIFQIGSTLTTASSSSVVVINSGGGSMCNNVFWQVGSSATLGTTTSFGGNILALTSIALNTGASVSGRALARNGSVTLDGSTVTSCGTGFVCPAIALAPATLPGGTVGTAYSQTITGSGGTAPYTFAVTSGTLPAGLTLTSAGVLAGTPTAAGSSTVTIRGTDADSCFAELSYTIIMTCPAITLSPATLPNATVGVAYSQTITGSGGTAPYTFTVTAGVLPAGLTLTGAGVLAGTPTTAGATSFTIRGTDAHGCFATLSAAPPVCPVITLSPATLPNGTMGAPYNQTIAGSGGTAPYTFTVTSGALPTGLTLTAAGVLSGLSIAGSGGTSTFTIRGTDANGCFADLALTLFMTTTVPTLPQVFVVLLAVGLAGVGYNRLRRRRVRAE